MTREFGRKQENKSEIRQFTLQRKYIEFIKSRRKTAEGRINSGGFSRLNEGDKIRFFDGRDPDYGIVCEINGIARYKGFREMLEAEGFSTMIPDVESLEEAVNIYNKIPSYTERAKRNGVLALRISVIKT